MSLLFIQIADDIKPNRLVISVLTKLTRIIPTWKIIPTPDIIDLAFRDPEVRKEVIHLIPKANYLLRRR